MSGSLRGYVLALLVPFAAFVNQGAQAAHEKTHFNVAWSIYVGWMPWDYARQSGILKKWADKYGIEGSVSHYFLARGLESVGLTEQDFKLVNTSDALIIAAFNKPTGMAAVTWKPRFADILELPNIFDGGHARRGSTTRTISSVASIRGSAPAYCLVSGIILRRTPIPRASMRP